MVEGWCVIRVVVCVCLVLSVMGLGLHLWVGDCVCVCVFAFVAPFSHATYQCLFSWVPEIINIDEERLYGVLTCVLRMY